MTTKDDENLRQVLAKLNELPAPARKLMRRVHDIITAAAPELRARLWYGMPGYALSATSPVLVFFRRDKWITIGVTEKSPYRPLGGTSGRLMPAAWFFDHLDDATELQISVIVRAAID